MRWFSFSILLSAGVARGQTCPDGAETGPAIPKGTRVTLLGFHRDDAYFPESSRHVGKTATVQVELTAMGGCWYAGSLDLDDGTLLSTYKVAVDAGGASGHWPDCPPDALYDDIRRGRALVVVAIHPDDAYAQGPELSVGDAVIAEEDLSSNGGCWFGGSIRTRDGAILYGYKLAFTDAFDACPAGALTPPIPPDLPVTVAALHPKAPRPPDHPRVGDPLILSRVDAVHADCWVTGTAIRPSGSPTPVARTAFVRGSGSTVSCPPGAVTDLAPGDRVRVAAVHVDDPYAGVALALLGTTGRLDGPPVPGRGCWVGLELVADGGIRYRFERVAVTRE